MKYVNDQANAQPSSTQGTEPQWREEWIQLGAIIPHGPLQVRNKLNSQAVRQYHDWTRAGRQPPPIKVGRVKDRLYLVDGWHRMEAGALVTRVGDMPPGGGFSMADAPEEVRALVADMTERQVRWEAAKANMGHGVPLKPVDYRNAFKAFIAAKEHVKPSGEYMSLREMGAVFGKGHTTVYHWVKKHCPAILAKLSDGTHGNPEGGTGRLETLSLHEEHEREATRLLQETLKHARALESPEARWCLLQDMEAAAATLRSLGVEEPAF